MRSKAKAVGLVLVAVFAMSAVAAQGAGAVVNHEFTSTENTTILTGHGENHVFETTWPVECKEVALAGTASGKVFDHVTLHPRYGEGCQFLTGEIIVRTEGCAYTFDSNTAVSQATTSIVCEDEHQLLIILPYCSIHTPEQTVYGVSYTAENSGSEADLKVTFQVTGITYEVTEEGFCWLLDLEEGTHHDGAYVGTTTVKGYVDNGVTGNTTEGLTGLEFTEGAQVGIGLVTP